MKNNGGLLIGLVIGLFLAWMFRGEIESRIMGPSTPVISVPTASVLSLPTPFTAPTAQVIYVQSTPVPTVPATVNTECQSPIKSQTGCKAVVNTDDTCAGMVRDGCEVRLSKGTGILVYLEVENHYMTTLVVNGHNIPFWVLKSRVSVAGN
jgi:hypothetical protein